MPNPIQAAAEGMPISRRSFLSGTATGAMALTVTTVAVAASHNEMEMLTALISRHRAAEVAVRGSDAECRAQQRAFDAWMKAAPVTYTTSAGMLIVHTEPMATGPYDRAVPLAIQQAHSDRQRVSNVLMQTDPSVGEDRAMMLARAKAIVMESRKIFLADLDARDAAAGRYDALWQVDCGKAEAAADSLQDAEVGVWEELRAFVCTSPAASRAKAEYVLSSQNLVDRIRLDDLDAEPAGFAEFILSLCGAGREVV